MRPYVNSYPESIKYVNRYRGLSIASGLTIPIMLAGGIAYAVRAIRTDDFYSGRQLIAGGVFLGAGVYIGITPLLKDKSMMKAIANYNQQIGVDLK